MTILQNGYSCEYELRLFANLYFREEENVFITVNFVHQKDNIEVYTTVICDTETVFFDYTLPFPEKETDKRLIKKIYTACCCRSLCGAAEKIRAVNLPWGVMLGVRPAKIVRQFLEKGYSLEETKEILSVVYGAKREKIELACTVAQNEKTLLSQIGEKSVSLYIGIPFCPTRCLYCSFVSTDVRVSGKYMEEFVNLLLLEIKKTAQIMREMDVYAENIYIGGGTPTTLSAAQLTMIFDCLKSCMDLSRIKEFTLEAGRPDTITAEKLNAAKSGGVNRISINPQTMNDTTLKKVGRAHTADMVRDVYRLARDIGFETINMDLIAGLPGENTEMFRYSLDEVVKLDPENITVHCMCLKRAADLKFSDVRFTEAQTMNAMLDYTQQIMEETARIPYYMYRQKNISGNLENVGYAKKGHMSVYNINIMEEMQTILAMGGGGSSKIVGQGKIERIFNFKDPYEYIRRFDDILKKKDEIVKLWNRKQEEKH